MKPIETMPAMHAMFLPEVEGHPQPGPTTDLIRIAQSAGAEYPKIWHLFAYRPEATAYLGAFTHEIMRGDGPVSSSLSPGLRELIAAFTSSANECPF
jgi:hypothetical protein